MPQPDPFANQAQRDAIAQAWLAQMLGNSAGGDPGSATFPEYQYPVDPADPADYSAAPSVSNVGFATNTSGHLADALSNPEGTLGSVIGNPAAGMPSPSMNAPSVSDLSQAAVPGDFGPAPSPGRSPGDFSAAFNAFDTTAATKGDFAAANPAGRISQGFEDVGFTAPTQSLTSPQPGPFDPGGMPGISVGDAIAADVGSLSALNADVNAAVNAAYGPGEVAAGPVAGPTAGPVAGPSTGNVASDVGVGIGLGISGGGFGGATGDGTSGGFGGDAGGPGVGGSSTGISGGPGGTGEGGANTGEGGTGAGLSGAGEGGGGGAGGGSGK